MKKGTHKICSGAQSCPTLFNPMDCNPPDSSIHGILQTRILEWVAVSFSKGSSWPRDLTCLFCDSCIAGRFFTAEPPGKPVSLNTNNIIYETSRQSRFDAQYWMLGAGALGQPRGMVWGGRREEGSEWGTHVYLWWIHFDIWQNQHNIVKFKNKIK